MSLVTTPRIDGRDQSQVLAALHERLAAYVPGFVPADGSSASAVLRVFARYAEIVLAALNQAPDRSRLAFLDALAVRRLGAQPARVPLSFTLMDTAPADVPLPAGSQAAATPSVSADGGGAPAPVVFATSQDIMLTRARAVALYSIDPGQDRYADHTPDLTRGFTLFEGLQPIEHALYLGHDSLFALTGEVRVILDVTLAVGAGHHLDVRWQYFTDGGWAPLKSPAELDTTEGLQADGQIVLERACGPDAQPTSFAGRASYWIRGVLGTPLIAAGQAADAPTIDMLRVRIGVSKRDVRPETAFVDVRPLDTGKDFYPFGEQPATFTTLYVASSEVFQRKGAQVAIRITQSQAGTTQNTPAVVWEYFDGFTWAPLTAGSSLGSSTPYNFTATAGRVSFQCPRNWAPTSVNGQDNYWLRVRLISGDFGQPLRVTISTGGTLVPVASSLQPPVVSSLLLDYTYLTEPEPPDGCLAYDDFVFADHTEDCRWPGRVFAPFTPVADTRPAIHVGFDRPLPGGLVSVFVNAPAGEEAAGESSSAYVWEYRANEDWTELGVLDETQGFRRTGMLQFVGPPDAVPVDGLGGASYRIRARLKQGEPLTARPIQGVWLNSVWASHERRFPTEHLGSSDGTPGQRLFVPRQRLPLLPGTSLEVREWSGSATDTSLLVTDAAAADRSVEGGPAGGGITAIWVRWSARAHLYASGAGDRAYVLDPIAGSITFGDGVHGRIPPADALIRCSYSSGGGLAGNVPAAAITELRSGAPYVISVTNPIAASGGADAEAAEGFAERGAESVRHAGRGVSARDLEWLAREASPAVAEARCLALEGPDGRAQRGWVALTVVPRSLEPRPQPSPELRRQVQAYLAARAPATVIGRVRVLGPTYTLVRVVAVVVPTQAGQAGTVEATLRRRLTDFFHPLTGGTRGSGWHFGQPVYLSQVAAAIEATPGVDYARSVGLRVGEDVFDDVVPIHPGTLVASGEHELRLTLD